MCNRLLAASILAVLAAAAPNTEEPAHSASLAWKFQTGGPVRSSPVVRDGAVYVGSSDGRLYAADAISGTLLWTADAKSSIASTPAATDTQIFVTTRANELIALDRRSGKRQWRADMGTDMPAHPGGEHWDYFSSSPLVAGQLVVSGSGDGRLYAFDARTGRRRWSFEADGRIRSSPRAHRDLIVFGTVRGSVYAVAANDGKQRWRFQTDGYSIDSAAAGFDRTSVIAAPAFLNDIVYIGSRDGSFYALSIDDGKERWRVSYQPSWVVASAAIAHNLVVVATSDGHSVNAYEAASGRERWRFDAKARVLSSPVVAGESLYVGIESGAVVSLDVASGSERWRYMTDGSVLSSPTLAASAATGSTAGPIVVVGSDDGYMYGLRESAAIARAVFWDPARRNRAYTPESSERIAEYFARAGYTSLTAATLQSFLKARVDDHRPAVVVFALDDLPEDVTGTDLASSLFRQYLESGGVAVWTGVIPPGYVRRGADGGPIGIRAEGPQQLTGVPHQLGNGDAYGLSLTSAGRQFGFTRWWLARGEARRDAVTTVLALDESGRAAAWTKSYGTRAQPGYVRLWGSTAAITDTHLHEMRTVIERLLGGFVTR